MSDIYIFIFIVFIEFITISLHYYSLYRCNIWTVNGCWSSSDSSDQELIKLVKYTRHKCLQVYECMHVCLLFVITTKLNLFCSSFCFVLFCPTPHHTMYIECYLFFILTRCCYRVDERLEITPPKNEHKLEFKAKQVK